jgi:hypothetical protein
MIRKNYSEPSLIAGMTYRGVNGLFCAALIVCFSTFPASAQDVYSAPQKNVQDTILFRPQAGIGVMNSDQYWHEGFRLLLNASDTKRFGLEYSRIHTVQGDFITSGIVLEKKEGSLNLSIGTVGYNGQGAGMKYLPGIVTNVGWEPTVRGAFRPFVFRDLSPRSDIRYHKINR